jgi:hypothetical protein
MKEIKVDFVVFILALQGVMTGTKENTITIITYMVVSKS